MAGSSVAMGCRKASRLLPSPARGAARLLLLVLMARVSQTCSRSDFRPFETRLCLRPTAIVAPQGPSVSRLLLDSFVVRECRESVGRLRGGFDVWGDDDGDGEDDKADSGGPVTDTRGKMYGRLHLSYVRTDTF